MIPPQGAWTTSRAPSTGQGAAAWSTALAGLAAKADAPLIDLAGFAQDVDAATATLGPASIAAAMVRRLGLYLPLVERGAVARRVPLRVASASCGKTMPAVAYVPKDVPDAGLPVLYLLHGAWGRWSDWSIASHDDLLQLSAQQRLVLLLLIPRRCCAMPYPVTVRKFVMFRIS